MLKVRHLRIFAEAAADLGKKELVDLVAQLEEARLAGRRAEMRQLIHSIKADHIVRHADIRQLIAELEEAHARRRQDLDELRAEVRNQLVGYAAKKADHAAKNREAQEEWQRQLAAIEQARRELQHQGGEDDK